MWTHADKMKTPRSRLSPHRERFRKGQRGVCRGRSRSRAAESLSGSHCVSRPIDTYVATPLTTTTMIP
jgi:hypothetical protein